MSVVAGKTITDFCDRLCISSFRKKCTLEKRTLIPPPTGTTQVSMGFETVHTAYYNITTLRGTSRMGGVNIDKSATHFFVTPWRLTLNDLDSAGEYFIRYNSKLYRVKEITNINEFNTYMLFQVEERGLDTSEESDA